MQGAGNWEKLEIIFKIGIMHISGLKKHKEERDTEEEGRNRKNKVQEAAELHSSGAQVPQGNNLSPLATR